MMKLYDLFIKKDATLVEINPMAITAAGKGLSLSFNKHPFRNIILNLVA